MGGDLEGLIEELGIVVANERDRAGLVWLFGELGADGIRDAAASLAGNRRPYVSNLAKAANLAIPREAIAEVSKAVARTALAGLRAALSNAKGIQK